MRIALVCDWYEPRLGGIELHLQDLSRRLTDAGHEAEVVTTTPGAPIVNGIPVHRVPAVRAPKFHFACTPAGLRGVAEVIRREKFDVVHAHVSIVSPVAFAGAQAAQGARIPTVLTFHSVVPRTRWLASAANTLLRCSRWDAVFTAVSRRVAHDIQPLAGSRLIDALPNGIDTSFWTPRPRPSTPGPLELVSVMRLNAKKRPLALVQLMRRLETSIDHPVRLRVAGDGPLRRQLERSVLRYGLGDRVEILGRLSRDGIRDLFAASDVFVLPTVRESFGLAALEARASGLPVVAMAQSGVAELVEHGVEGLLATSDAELARHTATLVGDSPLRHRIAEHNRETPVAMGWETVVPRHLEYYEIARSLIS